MAGGSGKDMNYWPGFVDVLTNLVMVLIFLIVVFTVALFQMTTEVAKQEIEDAKAKAEKKVMEERELMSDMVSKALEQVAMLYEQESEAQAEKKNPQASKSVGKKGEAEMPNETATGAGTMEKLEVLRSTRAVGTETRADGSQTLDIKKSGSTYSLVVSFPSGAVAMSQDVEAELDRLLAEIPKGASVRMTAQASELSPSEGKRLSFYRMAMLRNKFVQKGIDPQKIDMVIGDPAAAGDGKTSLVAIDIDEPR